MYGYLKTCVNLQTDKDRITQFGVFLWKEKKLIHFADARKIPTQKNTRSFKTTQELTENTRILNPFRP